MSDITVESLAKNASGNVAHVINVLAQAIVDRTNIGVGLEIIECHTALSTVAYADVNGIQYQQIITDNTGGSPVYSDTTVEVYGINTTVFNASENHQAILIPHYIKIEIDGDGNNGKIYEVKRWNVAADITTGLTNDTIAFIAPYLEEGGELPNTTLSITGSSCVFNFSNFTLVYAPKLRFMKLSSQVNFHDKSIVDLSSLTDIMIGSNVNSPFTGNSGTTIDNLLIGVGVTAYTDGQYGSIGDGIYNIDSGTTTHDDVTSIFTDGFIINEVRFVQTRFTNDIAYYRYDTTYSTGNDTFTGIAGGNYIGISGAQKPLLGFIDNNLYNGGYMIIAIANTIVYYPGSIKQIDDDDGTVPFKRFAVEKTDNEEMTKPFYVYGTLRGIAIANCHRY